MNILTSSYPRSLLVLTALCAAACSSSTAPDPSLSAFVGVYALASVDGTQLPVVQLHYPDIKRYLVADTISADGTGHYGRVTVIRTDSVGKPYSAFSRQSVTGSYDVRADSVDLIAACPPGALCVIPPIGWLSSDGSFTLADRFTTGFQFVSRYYRVR